LAQGKGAGTNRQQEKTCRYSRQGSGLDSLWKDSSFKMSGLFKLSGSPALGVLVRGRWILLDQILSSGTNFVLSFVLVRSVTPREFGAFGVGLITYQLLLSLARAQASEPLTIRYSQSNKREWTRAASHSSGYLFVLGLAAGAGMVVFGLFTDGALRTSLVTIGIVTPGLLVQDGWRYAFFALGKPARAAANDAILAIVQAAGLVLAATMGRISIVQAITAWGVAACVAAVFGAFQAGCIPNLRRCITWARENGRISGALSGDLIARGAAAQVALFAVGAIAGLASIGFLRASLLLFGPLFALIQGAVPFAVSEFVRLRSASPDRLWQASSLLSLVFGAGGLVLGGILLVMPDELGRSLLGSSWDGSRPLLPAMTAFALTAGIVVGPAVGLRAIQAVRPLMTVSLVLAPVTVVLAAGGALLAGAVGAAWGLTIANAIMAAALLERFRRANGADLGPAG
jgi:O-antigen/teichoic acid export membrane protein